VIIIGGLIGMWTRWCLGNRDPWLWVIFWVMEGKKQWSRPVLLGYWGLLCSISVAGWTRQLARSRRYRSRNATTGSGEGFTANEAMTTAVATTSNPNTHTNGHLSEQSPIAISPGALTLTFPKLPNGTNVSNAASDLMDAADKHVPTLGLNARRKFFHALAVAMFVPGIAYDVRLFFVPCLLNLRCRLCFQPAFTHLSFGVAFALFTFAEYVRYFAIYPFGAAVHLFMNEFLDHKDSGTAILSHFYLLTGCAGSLWLEGYVFPRIYRPFAY
jgi:dolichol kinase